MTKQEELKSRTKEISLGIGVDALPASIRNSKIFSGNDLGKLGNVPRLPPATEVKTNLSEEELHTEAKKLLEENRVEEAWKLLIGNPAE